MKKTSNSNTYNNILYSTAKLMVEKGYHGTSIRMISEKVGIQSSTLFYYFNNKYDILQSLLVELSPGFINELELIVEDEFLNGVQKLKNFFISYLGQLPEKSDVLKVFFNESKYLKENNKELIKKMERHYLNLIEKILIQIHEENPEDFAGIDLRVYAMVVYGICNWSLTWYKKDGKLNVDQMVDQFMKILKLYNSKN